MEGERRRTRREEEIDKKAGTYDDNLVQPSPPKLIPQHNSLLQLLRTVRNRVHQSHPARSPIPSPLPVVLPSSQSSHSIPVLVFPFPFVG